MTLDNLDPQQAAAEAHDLKEALLRLQTFLTMVEKGYDFTTPQGARFIAQMREAQTMLNRQCQILLKHYDAI